MEAEVPLAWHTWYANRHTEADGDKLLEKVI